jgi:8-oxo-dGTP diphosphatase
MHNLDGRRSDAKHRLVAHSAMEKNPVVGIQVAVLQRGALLLGLRRHAFGSETWGLPGGHLEFGESFEQAAARELFEETGLLASRFRTVCSVNTAYESTHYVQICLEALECSGSVSLREPAKCYEWKFFKRSTLPSPLFPPSVDIIKRLFGQSQADSARHRDSLCLYMVCHEPTSNKNRFVNYYLVDAQPITLIAESGRRGERRPRVTRITHFDQVSEALELLRRDISKRLRDQYRVYRCSGDLPFDSVLRLFPESFNVRLDVQPSDPSSEEDDNSQLRLRFR